MTFTLKIKIIGSSKPPIWRKVKVPDHISFDEFHIVIQVIFNWTNSHMYQFSPNGYRSYPNIRYNYDDEINDYYTLTDAKLFPHGEYFDSSLVLLNKYFNAKGQKMVYIYDFGDDWEHSIELIDISDELIIWRKCISGKANAPVDDCGGIHGYYHMVEIVNDPEHPDYDSWREWLGMEEGEKWDENKFDLEETNETLLRLWEDWMKFKKQQ